MAEGNQIHIDGSDNFVIQNAEGCTIIINQQTKERVSINHDLTFLPKIELNSVIGREAELESLYKMLQDKDSPVITVVNGLGGIGKTTVAQAYLTKYHQSYGHKVWITQIPGGDFQQDVALTQDLADNLGVNKETPTEQVFTGILQSLRRLQTNKNGGLPNLLIIDNADESLLQYKKLLPQPPHWHVLITSREELKPFRVFPLDFLDEEQACALYKKHHDALTDEQVKDIVTLVDRHTLTISILAQSAEENLWTYEQVRTALSEDRDTHITHPYIDDQPINKIKTFLTRIFNFSALSENQRYILNLMALMPSEFIPLGDIKELLQYESLDWQDVFVHTLNRLHGSGWLLRTEDKHTKEGQYKLHIIISDIIKEQAVIEENILVNYIDILACLLSVDETKDNPTHKFRWISYAEALISAINNYIEKGNKPPTQISILLNNLGLRQKDAGNHIRARDHLIQALKIDLENLEEDHPSISTIKNNLAQIYRDLGDLPKAAELAELSLNSYIKNFGEDHSNITTIRSNLALIYQDLSNLSKAAELTELALHSDIKNFGEDHINVTRDRNNLASIYYNLGDLPKAAELAELSLNSDIKNFGKDHPNIAIRRNNLAVIYKDLGDLPKAADLAELALNSDIKTFGEDHPRVAKRRNTLATIYLKMQKYNEGLSLFEKAYLVGLKLFGEDHPDTKIYKANLETAKRKAAGEE